MRYINVLGSISSTNNLFYIVRRIPPKFLELRTREVFVGVSAQTCDKEGIFECPSLYEVYGDFVVKNFTPESAALIKVRERTPSTQSLQENLHGYGTH